MDRSFRVLAIHSLLLRKSIDGIYTTILLHCYQILLMMFLYARDFGA